MKFGVACPCIPIMLSARGLRSSKHPNPCKVVVTGICKRSANVRSSSGQSLHPCPAIMTGFLARRMVFNNSSVRLPPTCNTPSLTILLVPPDLPPDEDEEEEAVVCW